MELNYAQIAAKGFPAPIATVYLFTGSDDALKREAVARLTEPLLDVSFADFDREERDVPPSGSGGDGGSLAAQILASAAGAPMASERRVVVVTNVQRLTKDDQEALAGGIAKLGSRTLLALIAGAPIYDAGKVKGGSVVGTKLASAVAKAGATVLCDAPGAADLKARANALVKSRGKSLEPAALEVVLARAVAAAADRGGGGKSGDIHVLRNELEKSLAYVGDRTQITRADVVAIGTRAVEENIFALLDAVGHRDPARAMAEVDEMLRAGDKPDAVAARTFVMLARHLRLVWGAKFLAEKRVGGYSARGAGLPPDVQAVLSGEITGLAQRQSFLLKGLQEQARGWTYPALGQALARVLASDLAMKSIRAPKVLGVTAPADDPASNLRLLVVDLCRPHAPA